MITGLAAIVSANIHIHDDYDEQLSQIDFPEISLLAEPTEDSVDSLDLDSLDQYVRRLESAVEAIASEAYMSEKMAPTEDAIYRIALGASSYVFVDELDIDQQDYVTALYLQTLLPFANIVEESRMGGKGIAESFIFNPQAAGFVHVKEVLDKTAKVLGDHFNINKIYLVTSIIMDRTGIQREGDYWVRSSPIEPQDTIREYAIKQALIDRIRAT